VADGRGDGLERLAAGLADIVAFLAAIDAPPREKQVQCCPLELGDRRKHNSHEYTFPIYLLDNKAILPGAGVVRQTAHNRLVPVDITVPDFQVIAAIGIGANPRLIMDRRSLTAKIR
jgi:hypothetical protein